MAKTKKVNPGFENHFGKVNDLPPGRGSGILNLKKGRRVEIRHGKVVKRKGAIVLEKFIKQGGVFTKAEIFGAGTKVAEWEQDEQCAFCPMPSCDGICREI